MTRRVAVERRRRERRIRDEEDRFWHSLHGERRVAERREIAISEVTPVTASVPFQSDAIKLASGAESIDAPTDDTQARNEPTHTRETSDVAEIRQPNPDNSSTGGSRDDAQSGSANADETALGARRAALRSMLDAAEARVAKAQRMRRPVLAKGTRVRVTRGEHSGREGVIEDADYIESRVLLRLEPDLQPCWVGFSRLGHALDD